MAGADFPKSVIETISKRVGNTCSNPDCGALTCGPSDDIEKAVVIGEAAHIYGARVGSARYTAAMSDEQRSDITNAVWLCRNCHKKVDADVGQYSAEILFEWRRYREGEAASQLGKVSSAIREKIIARQLREFSDCSYLAQQIVIDKPEYWEYKLTIELLTDRMGPVIRRWDVLKRGLYVKPVVVIARGDVLDWISARFKEVHYLIAAFTELISKELPASWGQLGQSGDPKEILRACDLIVEFAEQTLQWEEVIRFSMVPDAFEDMRALFSATIGRSLDQLARIPIELNTGLSAIQNGTNELRISLVLDLPEGWEEKMNTVMKSAFASLR